MTSVLNSPTDFARQHLRGFALLHAELLRPVDGFRCPVPDGELRDAWNDAARTATRATEATADLVARRGRARPLGARSLGHPDLGAVSLAFVLHTIGRPGAEAVDQ